MPRVTFQTPGSSPLTRGKRGGLGGLGVGPGLIPAHAGKTSSGSRPPAPPRAHPRSRGENVVLQEVPEAYQGSSPLTRGKRNQELIKATGAGLIPAHAGKTGGLGRRGNQAEAHPRSRGENQKWGVSRVARLGSSPLTRGKRLRKEAPRER